jgi:hypothetical protein
MLPPPPPFQRFRPTDGLLIRADHWQRAHDYHRQRQNLHFQALHQPGIVSGLGVRPIEAPMTVAAEYRNAPWVQVEPGLAIDHQGNPIVVPEAMAYRLAVKLPTGGALTVYLVVSYVDPDGLRLPAEREFVTETFRLDERTSPPQAHEIELCRMQLRTPLPQLALPEDGFFPQENQLDLGHRQFAALRPRGTVRVAQGLTVDASSDRHHSSLQQLMAAPQALYPSLHAQPNVDRVVLNAEAALADYNLIYITGQQPLALDEGTQQTLRRYLAQGGVVVVDAQPGGVPLAKSVVALANQWGIALKRFEQLPPQHPLREQPFLFAVPPTVHQQAIQLLAGGGLVLGNALALGWGLEAKPPLPRETLRSAQELGINLLHYAWRRRHLAALMGQVSQEPATPPPLPASPSPLVDFLVPPESSTSLDPSAAKVSPAPSSPVPAPPAPAAPPTPALPGNPSKRRTTREGSVFDDFIKSDKSE